MTWDWAQVARPRHPGMRMHLSKHSRCTSYAFAGPTEASSPTSLACAFQFCFTAADPLKDLRSAPLKRKGACWDVWKEKGVHSRSQEALCILHKQTLNYLRIRRVTVDVVMDVQPESASAAAM